MAPNAHRGLFLVAACFNWIAGLPLFVATKPAAALLGLEVTNATAALFVHLIGGLIVIFGGAYAMIARDPVRYRAYIPLGLILKTYVVVIVYGWWLIGAIPWPMPALAAGDIVFAVLFWRYYVATRPSANGIPAGSTS